MRPNGRPARENKMQAFKVFYRIEIFNDRKEQWVTRLEDYEDYRKAYLAKSFLQVRTTKKMRIIECQQVA